MIVVEGPRLDAATVPHFKARMDALVAEGQDAFVLDLAHVAFLDSSGLGAIVGLAKRLGRDGQLELSNVQPAVMKVFRLTRMDRVLVIREGA